MGLGRNGVGILEVNTGTAGVKAQIVASIVTASSYVDSAGKVQFAGGLVDKSTVPTLSGCTVGSTISGGGTFFRLVFGAGTNSTTCVVTMPATANTQTCGVTMSDTKAGYPIISAASTTTITISSSAPTNLQGLTAYVHCGNNP